MKKTILLLVLSLVTLSLFVVCCIQQVVIRDYEQSEAKWVEIQKRWREKLDTCMNRNERIYQQLYEFQDIRVKQLKGELPK